MTRGKWVLALISIILAVGCADQKSTQTTPLADTPENRKVAAQRYLEAVPPRDLLQNLAGNLARRLPEPNRKVIMDAMSDKELEQATYRITLNTLVKHFTPQELNAMAAFYSSPEGKSTRSKFGVYMSDLIPQISEEVRKVVTKKQEQLNPEPEKPGTPKGEQSKPEKPKLEQPKPEMPKPEPPKSK
jgi:hypothetical protein